MADPGKDRHRRVADESRQAGACRQPLSQGLMCRVANVAGGAVALEPALGSTKRQTPAACSLSASARKSPSPAAAAGETTSTWLKSQGAASRRLASLTPSAFKRARISRI